jgi:hypothetical protein
MDRFGYIVVLRETTTAYFDEHTTEAWNQAFPRRDITGRVAGPQIIGERQKYIDRRKTDFEGSSQSRAHLAGLALHCQTLSSILSNGYFRRNIYPAFNYDHRNAVTALTQAFCAAGASVDKLASNMQSGTQLNRHLARQAALRRLLNVFADSGYFDAIKGTEDRQPLGRGEGTSINTSRLILNTLLFGPRPLPPEALRDPRLGKGFSLMDLFGTFDPFIKPKVIAEALWAMFAIRGEESWAHLVTFKSHRPRNQDDLWEQADDYGSNARTRSKFSEVKITPAGVKFVTDFLGTYEYFASRIDGTAGCALYETDFDSKLDPLAYKAGMNRVLAEVQHCLGNIQVYHSEIMLNTRRGGIEPHAFLQSPLSYHVRRDSDTLGERRALVYDDEGRFYADQVINSHIGYLDSFRRWAGATRPDLAEEISDIVMGVIDGYIDIPKRGWLDISISRESMDLLEDYRRAREWISGDVGTRWRTPIDRVTGGRLRRGEPPLPARRR